jgi:alkanesulfonate monooxygenase SsuD/methylene tetrahydromethanopterin reductase-like flavin-dependent oxidoreductase (luciferase family)
MCAWADTRGGAAIVSQHHDSEDGYLPSPVPMAAAISGRTSTMPICVAALLLAMYEPVKLAEDLAVVDLLSRGRVSYVIGIGYRDEEFAMFGVDRRRRAQLVEERIEILRRLWTGEQVEVDGRLARISPLPYRRRGPTLMYGGGTEAAARRAGRLGMFFYAESHDTSLEAAYQDEAEKAGRRAVGCGFPVAGVPLTVFVADDPDKAWDEIGDYLLVDASSYATWNANRVGMASSSSAPTVAELRAEGGAYQIITPAEAADYVSRGAMMSLQPLVGGIPPDIAWPYLESAAAVLA